MKTKSKTTVDIDLIDYVQAHDNECILFGTVINNEIQVYWRQEPHSKDDVVVCVPNPDHIEIYRPMIKYKCLLTVTIPKELLDKISLTDV